VRLLKNVIKKSLRRFGYRLQAASPGDDNYTWLQDQQIRTILDIGANVGTSVQMLRSIFPNAMIYSFEPLRQCYEVLEQRFASEPCFRAFPFALGDREEETLINRSSHSPSSSLLAMTELHKQVYPHTRDSVAEKVLIKRLDDVVRGLPIEGNLLIKLDVQGYEDKVVRGGPETFRRARVLLSEVSFKEMFAGQMLFDEFYDLLRPLGFTFGGFWGSGVARDPSTGIILFADAVFLRKADSS
jgi:FkbM family methyltransferase